MLPPIDCASSLHPLEEKLVALLSNLAAEDWQRPTLAGSWCVHDVACHLLDTAMRKLAMVRDGHFGPMPEYPLVLDCCLRALPPTYHNPSAPAGIATEFRCGTQRRYLKKSKTRDLVPLPTHSAARVEVPPAHAWRIFTKGIAPTAIRNAYTCEGPEPLIQPFFTSLAIVA